MSGKTLFAVFIGILCASACQKYASVLNTQSSGIALKTTAAITVPDIRSLINFNGPETVVQVLDPVKGGVFNYTTATTPADNILIFPASGKGQGRWLRQNVDSTGISAAWFGIKGDSSVAEDDKIVTFFTYMDNRGGGKAVFPAGVYRIDATAPSPGATELIFSLPGNTTINSYGARFTSAKAFSFMALKDSITWNGGEINKGRMVVSASNVKVKDVTINYAWSHAFHLSTGKSNDPVFVNKYYRHIIFENCKAYRSGRHGFSIHRGLGSFVAGTDSTFLGHIDDLQMTNCTSDSPSWTASGGYFSQYDYGFGLENILSANNVRFTACTSIAAPGAGWHAEYLAKLQNITFNGCVAKDNGRAPNGTYGSGYFYRGTYTFINCKSINNRRGAFKHESPFAGNTYTFQNCVIDNYAPFSYTGQQQRFDLNIAAKGAIAGAQLYISGSTTMPAKGVDFGLFDVGSVVENGTTVKYFYNTQTEFDESRRTVSIGTLPLLASSKPGYSVSISAKQLSGATGDLVLYIQEFGADFKLRKNNGKFYTQRLTIPVSTTAFKQFDTSFVKGTDPSIEYVRAVLVFTDAATSDKKFAVSKFSMQLQ